MRKLVRQRAHKGILNDGLRPEKVVGIGFRTGVQFPPPPPYKNANFDTLAINISVFILCPKVA